MTTLDNVIIPSLQQLTDNALQAFQQAFASVETEGSIDAAAINLQRQNNQVLAFVNATGINGAYQFIQAVARQAIPINARGEFLTDWLATYGMVRKDSETEEQALARLLHRLANPPRAGSPGDYERWAMEVDGITRAWCTRNVNGPCTVGLVIMADGEGHAFNAGNGIPTVEAQTTVFDYIRDPYRGPADDLYVILPTPKLIDVSLIISPDSDEIRQAVSDELHDLFAREAVPAASMPHTWLTEAVSIAAGETTHGFLDPVIELGGELSVDESLYEVLVLNQVNFVEAA